MKILTTTVGLSVAQVQPFISFVQGHDVYAICNNSAMEDYLKDEGVTLLKDQGTEYLPHVRKYLAFKEALRGTYEPVILADCGLLLNIDDSFMTDNINVYRTGERLNMAVEVCDFLIETGHYYDEDLISHDLITGYLSEFVTLLWESLQDLPKDSDHSQALCNHYVYGGRVTATLNDWPEGVTYVKTRKGYRTNLG